MTTRRAFLGALSLPAAGLLGAAPRLNLRAINLARLAAPTGTAEDAALDEDYWSQVAAAFTVDRSLINLNNGGVSPAPRLVQDAMRHHLDFSNSTPSSVALWDILEPRRESVRAMMAEHWRADPEEIAFTRNASESLETCQFGFDLGRDDEVITTDQDYPRMRAAFRQRQRRDGIVVREISLPVPCEDDQEIVRRFEAQITPRTRLILVCHVINLTGQVLPVRAVVAMARRHGVPVIVDGAHALAHIPFTLPDLDCDYYATSLHKWLFAPHGTGLLYVRRNRISGLWPLMAADEELDADIRKFEQVGTHPAANTLAVAEALSFHQAIGDERKAARLRSLRDAWALRLAECSSRVRLHTSLKPAFSCAIATVQLEGVDSIELASWLRREHGIVVTAIVHQQFEGIRVSPSVYTTPQEIDRFATAMEWALRHDLH